MTYGVISGSEACFHLCHQLPIQSTRKSNPENFSSLQFKTQLAKPIISIKTPSGSYRGRRTRSAAAVNSLYTAAQENLYELLGVSERGTASEIKRAYKKLALKYHPDVSPPHRAAEYTGRFIRVQEAYETLSDPNTRAMYDRDLGTGLQLGSSRRRRHQKFEEWGEWRERWQAQLVELNRRSSYKKDSSMRGGGQVPWGAGAGAGDRFGSQRFGHGF